MFGAPKKTGKTGFAALHMITTVLLFGGRFAEGYALANDHGAGSVERVFQAIRRIVEASPLLHARGQRSPPARSRSRRSPAPSSLRSLTTTQGAAGANPMISCFDELWGYTSERSRRLWDEMVPPPTRKVSVPAQVTVRRLLRRERAAGGAVQARPGAARGGAQTCTPATAC